VCREYGFESLVQLHGVAQPHVMLDGRRGCRIQQATPKISSLLVETWCKRFRCSSGAIELYLVGWPRSRCPRGGV
jgi:hypothetical protein